MRNGYIVVAVDWRAGGQTNYNYSAREHRTITEALYKTLRKFSVNQDRVFIAGHGAGADAAYDIALAHPEHFAGVVGYSGRMGKYTDLYSDNKIKLRMYSVLGEKDFVGRKSFKLLANRCLKTDEYNELTLVQYNGRPREYFTEDIPEVFKWMAGPIRRWPDASGFKFECRASRRTDCYFWFYELPAIPEAFHIEPVLFSRTKKKTRFLLSGEVKGNNTIVLRPNKIIDGTRVWLSPEYFDFKNGQLNVVGMGAQKLNVVSSTKTLLDDVLRRGDTLHPYWAGVQMTSGKWRQID